MTPEEFRRYGYMFIDWVADYRQQIEDYVVMSKVQPGTIRSQLPTSPPLQGESMEAILADLSQIILPGITHWNHPKFFAYFPSNASLTSVLADLISTGLGVQCMSWQTSPAATELEEVTMAWLREMVGLPQTFIGVIQDTASTATLVAMLSARERITNYSQRDCGLQKAASALVFYVSEQAHSSVEKAVMLAGCGKHNVRLIATDHHYALRIDLLHKAIEDDIAAGLSPCALIATIGTTNTTAVDPLQEMASLAAKYGLWLHVDAAMAGNAMILPECRGLWAGIEAADSLLFNPHKWLGVAFDCTAYYVRDPQHLIRVMSTNPSVLQTNVDGQVSNFRDWGIPLGRRFRALKLWFVIREQGVAGLQMRLRRDLANAQWLKAQIEATADWHLLAPVNLQTLCVQHIPDKDMSQAEINAHNLAWVTRINQSGEVYLTPTMLNGKQVVRVSIGAEATEQFHVATLWQLMQTTVK